MFTSILLSKKYWISAFLLGLGFVIIFSFIEHIMEHRGIFPELFIEEKIQNGHWVRFAISRLVGGTLYGMIMAYYFEKRKRKEKQ